MRSGTLDATFDTFSVITVTNGNSTVAILNIGTLSPGSYAFTAVFIGEGTSSASKSPLLITSGGPQVTSVFRYAYHTQVDLYSHQLQMKQSEAAVSTPSLVSSFEVA
jgi:hypothetical protein